MSAAMEALRLGLPLPAYMAPPKQLCPVKGVCLAPSQCADFHGCILQSGPPLILTPMSDWRADPTPYPLRADTKPRAPLPAVFA